MNTRTFRTVIAGAAVAASLVSATAATAASSPRLAACSPTLVTSAHPVTLNFWESMPKSISGGSGNYGAIHSLVLAFNAAYKGRITVNDINQTGGYTQTWQQYVASLATHTSPNVVMFDQYNAQSALDTKSITPVSTCIAGTGFSMAPFSAKVKGAYTTGGKLVGMPFSASVPVMYYNLNAFAKAGITAPPTTTAQLLTDQTKLKATHWTYGAKSGTYKYGVSIKYDPWEISSWLGLADKPLVNNNNGHTARATSVMFNNSTAQGYVTTLQKIAKSGGGNNVYNPGSSNIFVAYGNLLDIANNNSGITFDTTAALGSIQSLLPSFPNVKMGVAPLPTTTGTSIGSSPPGGNGLFINSSHSSAAQQSAAWIFIQFLTSAKNLATWDFQTGYLPIRSDELTLWNAKFGTNTTQRNWYNVGYKALTKAPSDYNTQGPLLGPYNAVNNDITVGIQTALTTPYPSVINALTNAAAHANTDIHNYNSSV